MMYYNFLGVNKVYVMNLINISDDEVSIVVWNVKRIDYVLE